MPINHPALLQVENEKLRGLLRECYDLLGLLITVHAEGCIEAEDMAIAVQIEAEINAALSKQAEPAPAQNVEVLGQTCIDGGTCHHACTTRCFRRECCTHFSDYTGPWAYDEPAPAQDEREARINEMVRIVEAVTGRTCFSDKEIAIFEALATRPAQTEQHPVAVQVCKLGIYGKAYDAPETKRAYTYDAQPDNVGALKLGRAVRAAANASAGDEIDRGLVLLRALAGEGFGVFDSGAEYAIRPAQTAPQPEQGGLVEAWSGMKAIPVSAVEYEAIYRHNLGASPTSVVPGDGMTAKSGVSYIVSAALSTQGDKP